MSPYTIVLCKIDSCSCTKAAQKLAKKTMVVKAGAYIVSIDRKTTYTNWKLVKLPFLKMRALAVHSNAFHIPLSCR